MTLTSALFTDYLNCPTKCYLHFNGEAETGNSYAQWLRKHAEIYRMEAGCRLRAEFPEDVVVAPATVSHLKTVTWRLALDLSMQVGDVASSLDAIERNQKRTAVPGNGGTGGGSVCSDSRAFACICGWNP